MTVVAIGFAMTFAGLLCIPVAERAGSADGRRAAIILAASGWVFVMGGLLF